MKTILLLSFFLILSSCAATGPKFTKLEDNQDNKALVYILRPPAFTASARRVNISINNKLYIKLFNKGYTIAQLSSGVYEFKQSTNYIIGDPAVLREIRKFKMEVQGGKTYFIGFHADSAVGVPWIIPSPSSSTLITPITFKYGFGVIERKQALELLKKCNYQEPE
jgi:hypothetical protein